MWIDDGIPDDATGTFHRYTARVEASNVQTGRYTSLAVRFSADGVAVVDRYTLDQSTTTPFWGGPGGGIQIDYCLPPPVFVPGYVVTSAVGMSCGAAQTIVHLHSVTPSSSLFRARRHVEHVDGFRCVSSGYKPKSKTPDLPPFITRGSGEAQCGGGKHGFLFSYAE
jgi:hypothetical protein